MKNFLQPVEFLTFPDLIKYSFVRLEAFMQELSVDLMQEDALSCFLDCMDLKVIAAQACDLVSPWSFHCTDKNPSFYAVAYGECCLGLDDGRNAYTLKHSDLAILLRSLPHCLQDDLRRNGSISSEGTEKKTTLIRGTFSWDEKEMAFLFPEMPQIIHVKGENGGCIQRIIRAMSVISNKSPSDQLGSSATMNHLAFSILVQGLRAQLSGAPLDRGQVLEFMNHGQIGTALYEMHTHPEEPWSLVSLAKRCGMSRSAFAEEFKRAVGQSPMTYLLGLRMNAACDLLNRSPLRIKEVSAHAGYSSPQAFSNAFRRWVGMAPGTYRKARLMKDAGSPG